MTIEKQPYHLWINVDWRVSRARKTWVLEQRRIIEVDGTATGEAWDQISLAVNLRTAVLVAWDKGMFNEAERRTLHGFADLTQEAATYTNNIFSVFHEMSARLAASIEASWDAIMEPGSRKLSTMTPDELTLLRQAFAGDGEVLGLIDQWETLRTIEFDFLPDVHA